LFEAERRETVLVFGFRIDDDRSLSIGRAYDHRINGNSAANRAHSPSDDITVRCSDQLDRASCPDRVGDESPVHCNSITAIDQRITTGGMSAAADAHRARNTDGCSAL
jgi:hypothetical protein